MDQLYGLLIALIMIGRDLGDYIYRLPFPIILPDMLIDGIS